jgi:hypothetical protein
LKRRIQLIVVWLSLFAAAGTARAVQVEAQADRSQPIYAGSRFGYSIIVTDGPRPQSVDLGPLEAYHPSQPSAQSRTSIINGRSSSYQILTYQLQAPDKGDYTLPPVNVIVDGKVYRTNPVNITVVEPGTTSRIALEMELSASSCYVGQPVLLTLSLYVWADIVRAQQIGDIDLQVPILNDERFYVEDSDVLPAGASPASLPVNGRDVAGVQDLVTRQGVDCLRVRLTKVLIPKTAGTFSIQPGSVSADIAVGQSRRRDSFFSDFWGSRYEYKRFGARSSALELNVQPLPEAGRPDDFYGLVGNYTISADATPKEVNVGDPITLTIRIGGGVYLKPVRWPDLEKTPQMAELFRIPAERADGEIRNGVKVFTQTIRPNHDKVAEVPPIPLSFFDVEAGRYRTVYTRPIPLQVAPTRIVTGEDVVSGPVATVKKTIQAVREGLSANYTSADVLMNQRFSPLAAMFSPVFVFLYALPLGGLAVCVLTRYALSDSPQRRAAARRRRACSRAVKGLRRSSRHEKPSQQVLTVLKQYIADHFDRAVGALTAEDCCMLIREKTGDASLADRYREIMGQIEASEYSPLAFQLTREKQKEILQLLAQTEKKLR